MPTLVDLERGWWFEASTARLWLHERSPGMPPMSCPGERCQHNRLGQLSCSVVTHQFNGCCGTCAVIGGLLPRDPDPLHQTSGIVERMGEHQQAGMGRLPHSGAAE